jgi:hypothetical protein
MKRPKSKRRKNATRVRPLNLRRALDAHRKARVFHAAALKNHELFVKAHAAALDHLTEALMSRAMTDPIVEQCIRANSSGGPFDDTYRLDNIVGLRIDDLRVCLNDKLHLQGCTRRFGPISGSDTVGILKDHANQRYSDCHGGD